MPPEYTASFVRELHEGVRANYKYVWAGYDPTKIIWDIKKKRFGKGVDCSGWMFREMEDALYKAGRKAGVPGVRRTTSSRMARGLDGWDGVDHPGGSADDWLQHADEGDLVFFFGDYSHVGALLRDHATGEPGVAHASSSRGTVLDPIRGPKIWPEKDFSKIRRLTIGEKR